MRQIPTAKLAIDAIRERLAPIRAATYPARLRATAMHTAATRTIAAGTFLLALLFAASPAHAGKKKDAAPAPPVVTAPAAPTIERALEADIRKLLVATGAGSIGIQMMDQMMVSLKPMAPGLPDAFWDGVKAEFKADDLIDLVVPIMAESMQVGQVWGQQIAMRVVAKMEAEQAR